jgi:Fic family protein
MPARNHRAENKKKRSGDAARRTKHRSKPNKALPKKKLSRGSVKKSVAKAAPTSKKLAKAPLSKATATAKPRPATASKAGAAKAGAAVTGLKAPPALARENAVGRAATAPKGSSGGAAGKAGSAKGEAPQKPAKPAKEARRSTVRPAPPPLKPYKFIGVPSFTGPNPAKYTIPPPPPMPPPPPPASLEERVALVQKRLEKQDEEFRRRYIESFDMSWIYHDSALEGVVYSFQELKTATESTETVVQDSSLQPVCEEIRRHKQAIDFVRDFATKKRLPVTLDVIKRIYLILHPEEGDLKTLKYRKDIPQHRLYFHEYAQPDKIAYKVRQIVDWINDPETKRGRNALRIAARAHYDLLRVFPFSHDSGKVARLLMNMLLMRAGYEPAIIHSTERQRYYEALKGSAAVILHMAQEAEENGLASIEKLLEEHETNTRSFVS